MSKNSPQQTVDCFMNYLKEFQYRKKKAAKNKPTPTPPLNRFHPAFNYNEED